jgi:plastocyanin
MPSGSSRSAGWQRALLAASIVIAGGLQGLACAAGSGDAVVEVQMLNEKFVPDVLRVKPGTTVRWVNTEKRTSHSVHFAAEGLPESERMFPGESWQRRFDKAGRYPYVCGPHPAMKGVVDVVE